MADKATATCKCNDDATQHVSESSIDIIFTAVDDPCGNTLGRGIRVPLQLKEDAHDYLSEDQLTGTAKTYSQFIRFPIHEKGKKEVDAYAEDGDDDDDDDNEYDEEKDDVGTKDDDEKEKEEEKQAPTKKTVFEW